MFEKNKSYIFKVKNPESEKGFVYYSGNIVDIYEQTIFVHTIKDENVSFQLNQILSSKNIILD